MASSLTVSHASTSFVTTTTLNNAPQSECLSSSASPAGFGFSKVIGLKLRSHGKVVYSSRSSSHTCLRSPAPKVIWATMIETLEATSTGLVQKSINAIYFLAIDAIEKANSGHPGLPMGCAPMGHILYDEVMKYNPKPRSVCVERWTWVYVAVRSLASGGLRQCEGKEIQSDFDFTLICQNIHTGKEIQSDTNFTLICQNGGKR